MRRFLFTIDVFKLIRLIISLLFVLFIVFAVFQFAFGNWTFDGIVSGLQSLPGKVWRSVGDFALGIWENNKAAVSSFVGVFLAGTIFVAIMEEL